MLPMSCGRGTSGPDLQRSLHPAAAHDMLLDAAKQALLNMHRNMTRAVSGVQCKGWAGTFSHRSAHEKRSADLRPVNMLV